ncbi:hypothetical protein ASE19_13085 [Nocardioides sp. Root79]|nr:hypothetical protein ASE19_13085 [Nocardioides sp. Root79]KRC70623.1 hypothetical protein ASE20_11930 [Nocardioides sp. Root240]
MKATADGYCAAMRRSGTTLATLLLLCGAGLSSCSSDGAEKTADKPADKPAGLPSVLPTDDPCQWFSTDEATDALTDAGAPASGDAIKATPDPLGPSDDRAECWYFGDSGDGGRLTLSLINSADGADNWRTSIEDLRQAEGGTIADDSMGFRTTLDEIGGLPALVRTALDGHGDCEAYVPTGEDAFLAVDLGVPGDDTPAECDAVRRTTSTVLDRLRG